VEFIYPELEAKSRTVTVRLRFPNEDKRLKPNMFAQVHLSSEAPAPSLLIPREALIRSGSMQRVVVALGEGKFRSVKVQAGRESGQQVEILDGLMPGQTVVTSAQFMLDSESSLSADFSRMEFGAQAMNHQNMNHGGMDHSQMNHGNMGQSGMNHQSMDHSQMNHGNMGQSGMNHQGMDHSQMNHSMMAEPMELPAPTKDDEDLDWLDLDEETEQ
jgi:Cu(I)/Ag(I) efflux system membrane fusion protein